jgi:predicted transcriptional regulator
MNPRQLEALRAISHAPRTMNHFTAEGFLSPSVAKLYLDDLVLEGYVTEPPKQHGSYAITDAGRAYLASLPQVVPSRTHCAASMPSGSYVAPIWNVRAGGNDHARFSSRGIG